MVQVTLRLRPKNGYHYTNKIKTFTLDSSSRLEELLIVSGENGGGGVGTNSSSSSSSKSSSLYSQSGQELALNTSIASHNFENNELIETCKSPYMSAALTSVLKDMEQIKKQIPTLQNNDENEIKELLFRKLQLKPENIGVEGYWDVKQWNHEKLKHRTICLATMKKVLQRDDRYQVFDIPSCQTINDLYQHMESTWDEMGQRNIDISTTTRVAPNRMKYLLSPKTKRTGLPSTLWILIERKLEIQNEIRNRLAMSGSTVDPLEEFIRLDDLRHESSHFGTARNTSSSTTTASTRRRRRNEDTQNDIINNNENIDSNITTPSTTTRRTNTTSRRSKHYIPEYSSGPFAVLATLFEAMDPPQSDDPNIRQQRRELSLTESKLKHKAQRRCRSNLYDRGIGRGHRSAFACMEGLANRELVRKEIGNFGTENGVNIEKWSLLTKGEQLGRDCLSFQKAVNQVLPITFGQNIAANSREQRQQMGNDDIMLIVDNREDPLFRDRLKMYCDDDKVPFEERELPAGDYLFVTRSGKVIPLVIERKSWSDLADSVMGRGKANRRLDCVSIKDYASSRSDSIEQQYMQWQQDPHCARQNCQLCKMKRSGCSQIMFIIEGSWCAGRDDTRRNQNKCTREKRCQSCKALMERHHGVTDEMLQKVLHRLQVQHGCHVHFTNSYNETITSLFMIRKLLMEGNSYASAAFDKNSTNGSGDDDDLNKAIAMSLNQDVSTSESQSFTYDKFLANTRRSNLDSTTPEHNFHVRKKQDVVNFAVHSFVSSVINDEGTWRQTVCKSILGDEINQNVANDNNESIQQQNNKNERQTKNDTDMSSDEIEIVDDHKNDVVDLNESNESDSSIEVIDIQESQDPSVIVINESQVSIIDIDDESDSDGTIDLVDSSDGKNVLQDVQDDESNSVRAVNPIDPNHQIHKGTPLVVLQQMQSYNERFMKDIHKVWKDLYSQKMDSQSDTNITETNIDIFSRSKEDLQNLKLNEAFPLIRREPFLFATLFIQIKLGVILRIASKNEYANEIIQLWNYSCQADARVPQSTSIPSAEISNNVPTNHSRQRSQNVAAQREHNVSTTSAGRSTNTPIQSSSSTSNPSREQVNDRTRGNHRDRTTVAVNEAVRIAEPIRTAAVAADKTASNTTAERITEPSKISSQHAELIKARLRRFEKEQPKKKSSQNTQRNICEAKRPATVAQNQKWACKKCTLENPLNETVCDVCGESRFPSSSKNLPPQQSHVTTSTPISSNTTSSTTSTSRTNWTCKRCTCVNPVDEFKCDACNFGRFEDIKPNVHPNVSTSYGGFEPNRRQDNIPASRQGIQHNANHRTNDFDLEFTSSSQRSTQQKARAYSNNISSVSNNIPRTMSSGLYLDDDDICTTTTTTTNNKNKTPNNRKIASVKRCGACGSTGHTRANATPENCTAYYDDAEVQRRLQKELKIQEKATRTAQELREAEATYKAKDDDNSARMREMERLLEEQRKNNEACEKLREDDLKRKRKAADRAKKAAEKRPRF